ncbi:MAG: hypothetical protein A3I68_06830 [Candidatus Melainabacteria bacterium RIFCSPLOWO2_02_FULL_35_15]|nr:MAG: hypothetical protein A3F80_04330 [Candidatus Melainabacteria bacterium RIFCSPLOWO2_12_FULL_35_11]OGI13509.1 MAG: hypothetical protein A3I68_06830 [Candidatus Melainabacteria bacterium RIFCSPLOWO2_02_FULL_35_15]
MVKIKNSILISICLLFLLLLLGCSVPRQSEDNATGLPFGGNLKEVKVYFTKSKAPEELSLVPASRKISKNDSIVSATLKELFLGPTKSEELRGVMTEIPVGTRLIKVEEGEDEVLIDLSSQYLTGGGSAAMQLRYLQIYKTLKKICPLKNLYLNVEGKSLKTIGGEGLEVTQPLTKIHDYTKKHEKTKDVQP